MAEKKKSSALKWIVVIIVLTSAVGTFMVRSASRSQNKKGELQPLPKVQLKEDIVAFVFGALPDIYAGLFRINREIILIDNELERLEEIEAEFPRQKNIVSAEKSNWKQIQRSLFTALSAIEKDIENIYVTRLVNKAKGKELIDQKKEFLEKAVTDALNASAPHTGRLTVDEKKTAFDKLKGKLFS